MIRRILPHEVIQLEDLQKHGLRYGLYYPKHAAWLKRALSEIEKGRRRAYVYWGTVSSTAGNDQQEMLGSIMLRVSSAEIVEIKNLVVRKPGKDEHIPPSDVGPELITRVIEASRRRGFSRLETELPADAKEQIQWFLNKGFQVQASRESSAAHIPFYLLRKDVIPCYRGDPFDSRSMARWLLTKRLGWRTGFEEPVVRERKTVCFRVPFILSDSGARDAQTDSAHEAEDETGLPPETGRRSAVDSLFRITGECLVDNGQGSPADLLEVFRAETSPQPGVPHRHATPDIRLFVASRHLDFRKDIYASYGVRAVVGQQLLDEIGYWSANAPIQMTADSVAGVIVQLGTAFTPEFHKRCEKHETFEYVVTNGVGQALHDRMLVKEKAKFSAIFCSEDTSSEYSGRTPPLIIGIATIDEIRPRLATDSRSRLYNGLAGAEFVVDEFTANFNAQDLFWQFTLSDPVRATNNVLLENCVSSVVRPFVVNASSGEPLPCYADKESLDKINQTVKFAAAVEPQTRISKPLSDRLKDLIVEVLAMISHTDWLWQISRRTPDEIQKIRDLLIDPVLNENRRGRRAKGGRPKSGSLFSGYGSKQDIEALLQETRKFVREWTKLYKEHLHKEKDITVGELNEAGRIACIKAGRLLKNASDLFSQDAETLNDPLDKISKLLDSIEHHKRRFSVALTFSGQKNREIIRQVAAQLAERIGKVRIMFDEFIQLELEHIKASDHFRTLYFNESELIVVFITPTYIKKNSPWTSRVEWGQIRHFLDTPEARRRIRLVMLEPTALRHFGLNADRDIFFDATKIDPQHLVDTITDAIQKWIDSKR